MATSLSNLLALLALDNSAYLDGLTSSHAATDSFADKLANVGGAVVLGGITAAATAVTAVGAAAWDAGNTMDEAMDTIATATGAIGPELEGLREDFEAVFASVPTDAKTAADVIGVLNSRLDATGPALQGLAEPLLEVSRILGGDAKANAELFTRVMGDWNIPLEQGASSLDTMFVAAQKTGAPLDQLLQQVVQYGAPMRNFGFDFEEATALLASFAAEGVNTEIVMSGLRTAQGKFIKNGVDMKTGLWETIDAIQNAESATEGMSIAVETFGAKAAGDMFDTIRSGKFDIDELVGALQNADGAITETADATADWAEKWQTFKNKITVALAPIGEGMMEGLGEALDSVAEIFQRPEVQTSLTNFTTMIGDFITKAVEYIPILLNGFMNFVTFLQNNQGIVIAILAALGVAALAWGITTAAAAWTAIAPFLPVIAVILLIVGAVYLLYQAWTTNFLGIRDRVMEVWAVVQPVLQGLWNWLSTNIPLALQALSAYWTGTLLPALQQVWEWIQTNLMPLFMALSELIGVVLMIAFKVWITFVQTVTLPLLMKLWTILKTNVFPILQTIASFVGTQLANSFRILTTVIGGITNTIQKFTGALKGIKLPSWLTPGSPTPWELGLRGVRDTLQELSRSSLPEFQAAVAVTPLRAAPVSAATPAGGGSSTGGGAVTNITIHNPIPEKSADSVRRTMRGLSYLGRDLSGSAA